MNGFSWNHSMFNEFACHYLSIYQKCVSLISSAAHVFIKGMKNLGVLYDYHWKKEPNERSFKQENWIIKHDNFLEENHLKSFHLFLFDFVFLVIHILVCSWLRVFSRLNWKRMCVWRIYAMELEFDAIRGHKSAHSFATGPVIAEPFISPLLFTITPALSSKYMKTPSRLRNGFRCRMTTAGIT